MPQYQGVWSLQQQMQALTSGQWATDPLFDYTTLLLQADDRLNTEQNNTFLDSSTNQFLITRNGNTTQGTFSPFSATGWSNYFDGSGDYISMPSATSALALGSGDWTIECFVNVDNLSGERTILDILDGNSANRIIWRIKTSGLLAFQGSNGTDRSVTTTTVPTSTWVHLAICKASGTTRMFINGVQANSNYTDSNTYANSGASTIGIIASDSSSAPFLGYISNFRVVKGTALYTANFTPSPTALTAVTNTSLLTCQSNRFIDNSTNALSLTIGGTPSVQAFSPFAPQFQYTASVTGGSGYFDGTGDYLTAGSSVSLSGNFTFECWVYGISYGSNNAFYLYGLGNDVGTTGITFLIVSGGRLRAYTNNANAITSTSYSMNLNSWNHVAFVRNSGTLYAYLNGVQVDSASLSGTFSGLSHINAELNGTPTTTTYVGGSCYICGHRVTASAVYTSAFTPPTAPPTAITNTQLLLNFTNAGILDGTMKNNLETVGNASVSTSVVKYGSGSMYNPGTTGSYLTRSVSSQLFVFPGDFTIEFWAWKSANGANAYDTPVSCDSDGNVTNGWSLELGTVRYMFFVANGGAFSVTSSVINPNDSAWHHYAVTRSGSTVRLFRDGVQIGSGTYSATIGNSSIPALKVFAYGNATTNSFNGYIDDLRITNGIARYTQNFIPPSVALPRQ